MAGPTEPPLAGRLTAIAISRLLANKLMNDNGLLIEGSDAASQSPWRQARPGSGGSPDPPEFQSDPLFFFFFSCFFPVSTLPAATIWLYLHS